MSGPSVPDDDMPICSWLGQPDSAPVPDTDLTALLAGKELPPDAPAALRPVAEVLAGLRARPADDELAAESAALVEFRQQAGVSVLPGRSRRRRPTMLTAVFTAAAVIAALAAVSLGAYTGGLPGPIQRLAHDAIGAPAAGGTQAVGAGPVATGTPSGHHGARPPTGHHLTAGALSRLCTSYERTHENGGGAGRSAAFQELIREAGGVGNVAAFCAAVPHPRASPSHPPHKKSVPHSHGNGNSQGDGNGNPPGSGNSARNADSLGNGNFARNGNAQCSRVPDSRRVHKPAPHP